MSELTDHELDYLIAEKVMGFVNTVKVLKGRYGATIDGYVGHFSTDRNAAHQVLERIAKLGLQKQFIETWVSSAPRRWENWSMFTATSRQICEAALAAVEERTNG